VSVPAAFRRTVVGAHGDAGAAWLERLPELVAEVRATWRLKPAGTFPLSYGYVEPVVRADGSPAVLKLTLPSDPEAAREAAALAAFAGEGAARLLAHDPDWGALLLERLVAGTQLAALEDDDAATLAAADVMRRLHRPPPDGHAFPRVGEWGAALDGATRREFDELCASAAAPVLLHGDLHHFNILRSGDGWAAIDPKGVIGEPAYEAGALLRNPLPTLLEHPHPERLLARRIDLLAETLDLDAGRLRAWGRVQAALAAAWSEQAGDAAGRRFFTRCAGLLGA
jgi:streptomycin 6-kinase